MLNGECSIVLTSSERRLRAVYLVRGSVLSLSFVEPNKPNEPNRPDEPDYSTDSQSPFSAMPWLAGPFLIGYTH
jgi:hypothetical protein